MKKKLLCLILPLILVMFGGCAGSGFSLGHTEAFRIAADENTDAPLYSALGGSNGVITTDYGTYIIQTDGMRRNGSSGLGLPENYTVLRHTEDGWVPVFSGKTCGKMPDLALCSNQRGKLIALSPEEFGLVFGIYDEVTGEFHEVRHPKTGYALRKYTVGADPASGAEGKIYVIVSQAGLDENTLIITLDVASGTVTEQEFCNTAYPASRGYMVFSSPGNAHVVLEHEGTLVCFSASSPGTAEQRVSDPEVILDNAVPNTGFFDVALDNDGGLHVFCLTDTDQIAHSILKDGKAIFSGTVFSKVYPFACFSHPEGDVFLVTMQASPELSFEATVFRISPDGTKTEEATLSSRELPGTKTYFNLATSRLGGKTENGSCIFYLSSQKDLFVTAELEKSR